MEVEVGGQFVGSMLLRRSGAQTVEGVAFAPVLREMLFIVGKAGADASVEEVKAESFHFFFCFLSGPTLLGYAVGGNHHAGAVITEVAVNKNFFPGIVAKQLKELGEDIIPGKGTFPEHGNVPHAEALDGFMQVLIFSFQTNHDGDAHFGEARETFLSGTSATI